jgi:hypothetical protein
VPSTPTHGLHRELLFSDCPSDSAGIRGKALKLGPTESHLADSSPPISADSPWTISFWVQVENTSLACLLSTMVPGTDRRGFELLWQKGRLKLSLVNNRETSELRASTRYALPASGWHHVAVVWQGANHPSPLQVFTDGKRQALQFDRQSLSGSIAAGPLWIGRSMDGLGFSGRLDQLRTYNRALSDSEILDSLYRGEQLSGILETAAVERTANQQLQLQQALLAHLAPAETVAAWQRLQDAKQAASEWLAAKPQTLVMADLPQARDTFVLLRGQYDQPGERVLPDVPAILPALPPDSHRNRLTLARWLVDPAHPLTSRVLVNRWWAMLFGTGLVRTPGDFGAQSEPPDHPQLLDWLAVDFREQGWNLKALLKEMVLSATYRQSAAAADELLLEDPENRQLARGPRFRLPGSSFAIRHSPSAVCLHDGSVVPVFVRGSRRDCGSRFPTTESFHGISSMTSGSIAAVCTSTGRDRRPPALLIFDSPTRETCSLQRPRTNTPLQALVLLNDPAFIEASRCLASRILTDSKTDPQRLALAFSEVLARSAEAEGAGGP